MARRELLDLTIRRALIQADRIRDAQDNLGEQGALRGPAILLRAAELSVLATLRLLTHPQSVVLDPREAERFVRNDRRVVSLGLWLESTVGLALRIARQLHAPEFDPFIAPFVRLVRAVQPDLEPVFVPTEQHNYGLDEDLVRRFRSQVTWDIALTRELNKLPQVRPITLPATAQRDPFQLPLVAHEVGHLILSQSAGSDGGPEDRVDADLYDRAKKSIDSPLDDDVSARGQAWFVELACDLIGLHLAGPAFVFATYAHTVSEPWQYTDSGDYAAYPALAWRLARLREELDVWFGDEQNPLRDTTIQLMGRVARAPGDGIASMPEPERETVDAALQQLRWRLDDLIPPAVRFTPEAFNQTVPKVIDKLNAGVLPCENVTHAPHAPLRKGDAWSQPLPWQAIVNGGWLWRLEDGPAEAPHGKALGAWRTWENELSTRGRFLLAAVELSEIHLHAAQAQDEMRELIPRVVG